MSSWKRRVVCRSGFHTTGGCRSRREGRLLEDWLEEEAREGSRGAVGKVWKSCKAYKLPCARGWHAEGL